MKKTILTFTLAVAAMPLMFAKQAPTTPASSTPAATTKPAATSTKKTTKKHVKKVAPKTATTPSK